ncbi:MAG: hypothetical protein WCY24_04540 [Lutispora sp.]|nr:hypothetical protein [Lutispora sp.]MDD4833917.1 hypothetical protein [Lutispora sp.]
MFGCLGHKLGVKGFTSNPLNVKSGMIYIDLDSKNRSNIYNAYNNGASQIITNKSISDPSIPIIVVKDIEAAYLALLNLAYEKPLEKINFVGIYGDNRGDLVTRMLDAIFACYFSQPAIKKELTNFTYALVSEKLKSIAEKFFYYILLCLSNNTSIIPLNYSIDLVRFESLIKPRYDCNILIDECQTTDNIIYNNNSSKPFIINIDEPNILQVINVENENIVITYGLNKKAAVTATSIEYDEITKFNYCLQRTFYSKSGRIVEPFEVPISLKGLGINKIYSALASISCALYYDIDLSCIKRALDQVEDKDALLLFDDDETNTYERIIELILTH